LLTRGGRKDQDRAARGILFGEVGPGVGLLAQNGVEGGAPRLGLHDHSGAAAVGSVVDRAVTVVGVVAQVVHAELDQAALAGLAEQG
jgi:hypothetical protein